MKSTVLNFATSEVMLSSLSQNKVISTLKLICVSLCKPNFSLTFLGLIGVFTDGCVREFGSVRWFVTPNGGKPRPLSEKRLNFQLTSELLDRTLDERTKRKRKSWRKILKLPTSSFKSGRILKKMKRKIRFLRKKTKLVLVFSVLKVKAQF